MRGPGVVETLVNQYKIDNTYNCKAMSWTTSGTVGFLFRQFVFGDCEFSKAGMFT